MYSSGIFVERSRAWRQLNPRMPAALVDGKSRRWKARVSKRAHGDAHRLIVTIFGVEDGSPTNWAKPEYEPCSLIPDTDVFGGGTEDFERSREAGQCCEDTAGPLLAGEAVANANSTRFAIDLNAQLSAGARGCSERHLAPRRVILVTPNGLTMSRAEPHVPLRRERTRAALPRRARAPSFCWAAASSTDQTPQSIGSSGYLPRIISFPSSASRRGANS